MKIRFARPTDRTLRLIVTGTGRSGTGFAARWLTSIGIPAGHEQFWDHRGHEHALHMLAARHYQMQAECSWEAAPYLSSQPLKDALAIHQVRHPKKMIESCMRVPPSLAPHYAMYLERHLPPLRQYKTEQNKAACRWVYWNLMIEELLLGRTTYFWRIEDGTDGVLDWLDSKGVVDAAKIHPAQVFTNTRHNHKHGDPVHAQLENIHPTLIQPLREMMERYGYDRWGAYK